MSLCRSSMLCRPDRCNQCVVNSTGDSPNGSTNPRPVRLIRSAGAPMSKALAARPARQMSPRPGTRFPARSRGRKPSCASCCGDQGDSLVRLEPPVTNTRPVAISGHRRSYGRPRRIPDRGRAAPRRGRRQAGRRSLYAPRSRRPRTRLPCRVRRVARIAAARLDRRVVFMRNGHRRQAGKVAPHPIAGIIRGNHHPPRARPGMRRTGSERGDADIFLQEMAVVGDAGFAVPANPVRRSSGRALPPATPAGRTRHSRGHARRRECQAA